MAIRKENSVATRRSKPKSSAPIMVEPERENAWNQRKTLCKADFKRIADGDFTQRANPRRAARIAAPALYPQNHDASRNQRQCNRRRRNSAALIGLAKSKPSAAAGAHASAILN